MQWFKPTSVPTFCERAYYDVFYYLTVIFPNNNNNNNNNNNRVQFLSIFGTTYRLIQGGHDGSPSPLDNMIFTNLFILLNKLYLNPCKYWPQSIIFISTFSCMQSPRSHSSIFT
jgi:hypothetical protein